MKKQVFTCRANNLAPELLKSLALPNINSNTKTSRSKKKFQVSPTHRIPNQRHNTDWFHSTWDYINSFETNPSTKRAILIRAATDFNADFTAPQLAKLVSCDPSVIYKDMKSFIAAGVLRVKIEGSYDKCIATIYELIPYSEKETEKTLKGLTRTLLESRNKVFYQEFAKTFSVISSKTVKWALFMWIMGQHARPWTTKALADYAACSIITIERAIAALKAAGLITTRSKTKVALYRFSKLVPSFTAITVKYAAYKSAAQLRLNTELGIDANTNSSSVTNTKSSILASTNSKNWSAFNLQANTRAEFRYRSRFGSKYNHQYNYCCSSNYGYKHNSCSNAKCYISTNPKIITGLPVKDTIERLKVLGIDRAGSVKILRNYPDSDSCTNFNEIERAITIKLATDGSRIANHGAFSYKAFMDCYGLGLDLVAEVEHYQRYKRVDYQKAVYKLTKQSNSNNQSFTKVSKKTIGKANCKEAANTTEKHGQDIELLHRIKSEVLTSQLIGAMQCQVPPMPELSTSVKTIRNSPATQVLWDDLHLAAYIIEFLQGLNNDLTRWQAEETSDCIDLWTRISNYNYLNKLISSTADASEIWRHSYFYNVLSHFKELIARELIYQNKYLEDSATRLGGHLEKHELVISAPNKSPYDISTLSPFFISYPQQKTTPLSNLQLLLKDKKHHYEHSKNKSYIAKKHSSLREHAKSPQVE